MEGSDERMQETEVRRRVVNPCALQRSDLEMRVPPAGSETSGDGKVLLVTSPEHTDETLLRQRDRSKGDAKDEASQSEDDDEEEDDPTLASMVVEQAERMRTKVMEMSWKVTHFGSLPQWLQDNDYIVKGYRPPLPSFCACFKSIFRIHTETGNIWTHGLGCIAFIALATYYLTRPSIEIQLQEKIVFACFFGSAIICLGLSFMFHTMYCHSPSVGRFFSRLDYCGIAILITGSFIPWLYYGFYCKIQPRLIYLTAVLVLGITSMFVSLREKFGEPGFRWLRAGVFMTFGLSGIIPACHYLITEGFIRAVYEASLGWLALMAVLYIMGACFYAMRVPERFFPGKCDIWFHSHQIFHVLVIAAAFVHYHGISTLATYRLTSECAADDNEPVLE
jgi:adiponectin receptor